MIGTHLRRAVTRLVAAVGALTLLAACSGGAPARRARHAADPRGQRAVRPGADPPGGGEGHRRRPSSSTTPARWTASSRCRAARRAHGTTRSGSPPTATCPDRRRAGPARPPRSRSCRRRCCSACVPPPHADSAGTARRPTWAAIADAAAAGKFTYGMTNPASSNSGLLRARRRGRRAVGHRRRAGEPAIDRVAPAAEGLLRRAAADRGILRLAVGRVHA